MLLSVLAVALIAPHAKPVVLSREESARHCLLGIAHAVQGDRLRAAWEFTHAVHFDPTNADAWHGRAWVFQECQMEDQAMADYSRVLRLGPDADAYFQRGYLSAKRNDHRTAVADFNQVIGLNPRNEYAWRLRGFCRTQLGETEAAVADLTRSLELDPRSAETLRLRGGVYAQRGEAANAIRDLDAALELRPDDGEALTWRGAAHGASGNPDLATADFTRALRLDPNNSNAIYNRAVMNIQLGRDLRAAADLDRLIALKPADPDGYTLRAELHARSGDREIAIRDYTRLIALNPKSADVYRKRSAVHTADGNHPAALADLEKVAELEPKAEAYRELAKFHLDCPDAKLKNAKKAIDLADKAWALARIVATAGQPFDPSYEQLRSSALANTGDYEKAIYLLDVLLQGKQMSADDLRRVSDQLDQYKQILALQRGDVERKKEFRPGWHPGHLAGDTGRPLAEPVKLPPLPSLPAVGAPAPDSAKGLPPIIIPVIQPNEVVKKE